MKQILFLVLLLSGMQVVTAQKVPSCTSGDLMTRVVQGDTTYIVNFWATWCAPCVKELPVFDTLQDKYRDQPVKVLLVSLDFKDDYEDKIATFVARRKPQPEIVWFSETNANVFIPRIDDRWTGAIPATLIIRGEQKEFLEQIISVKDITGIVDRWLE